MQFVSENRERTSHNVYIIPIQQRADSTCKRNNENSQIKRNLSEDHEMTDFLLAALPWVIIGIAIAIIAANFGRKKRKLNTKEQENLDEENLPNKDDKGNYMSVGMCLGMCIGTVFSSTGIVPLSYGISFGMLIGMVVGTYIKKG